jgi:hypothetical protein
MILLGYRFKPSAIVTSLVAAAHSTQSAGRAPSRRDVHGQGSAFRIDLRTANPIPDSQGKLRVVY